jgi:dGTPase
MIGALVGDLLTESTRRIRTSGVATPDNVRRAPTLIGFTPAMKAENANLKRFLLQNLYRHPRVIAMTDRAGRIVRDLFAGFMADLGRLPAQYHRLAEADHARTIADYIAGMTDRYAIREHGRLFGPMEAADTAALWEHAGHGY